MIKLIYSRGVLIMNKKGFTLIELLAVIIIIAVVGLIAIPSISGTIDNSRRKAYEELKKMRQELKQKKEKFVEKAKAERERIAEKKRRKEINMLKSGGYEIIKNTQKLKKWKRHISSLHGSRRLFWISLKSRRRL